MQTLKPAVFCSLFCILEYGILQPKEACQMDDDSTPPEKIEFTAKELEVIRLLAEGKSTQQIALHFGVSTRAIEYHLTNIYEKLGISSRTEAIIRLIHLFGK